MDNMNIGFIGAGNIAKAIIGGLLGHGLPASHIRAVDPSPAQLAALPEGIEGHENASETLDWADVLVLCVKPNLVSDVCREMGNTRSRLVISVAAGITTATIAEGIGDAPIVRCMPNTPALVGLGMTGLFANAAVSGDQRRVAETVMGAIGEIEWFEDESQLDAVTAVSGSGPAYFFYVMEAMEAAAVRLGLAPEVARKLVLQTALGAASMAAGSSDAPAVLRRNVTSPGGTTEAALNELAEAGLPGDFQEAMEAAYRRSIELAGVKPI